VILKLPTFCVAEFNIHSGFMLPHLERFDSSDMVNYIALTISLPASAAIDHERR
jgi:hypothetical protein